MMRLRRSIQAGVAGLSLLAASCGRWSDANDDTAAAGGASAGASGASSAQGGAATSGFGGEPTLGDGGASTDGPLTLDIDWSGAPIYTRVARLTNSQWGHA